MAPASCAGSSTRLRSTPTLLRNRESLPAGLALRTDMAHRRVGIRQVVLRYCLHTLKTHYQ